jgi:hypothetical protein
MASALPQCAFSLVLALSFVDDSSRAFRVQGVVHVSVTDYLDQNAYMTIPESLTEFDLYVADCRWQLALQPLQSRHPEAFLGRTEVAHEDGTQYAVQHLGASDAPNEFVASIYRTDIGIFGAADETGLLWLIYASHCYFQTNSPPKAAQVPFTRGVSAKGHISDVDHYVQEVSADLFGSFLPKRLLYFETDQIGRYTNAILRVEKTDRIGDVIVPLEASLQVFTRDLRNNQIFPQYVYTLRATNVFRDLLLEDVRPAIQPKTLVFDARFYNDTDLPLPTFRYFFETNAFWYSDEEIVTRPAYKEALREYRRQHPTRRRETLFLIVLLFVFLGFPVIFYTYRKSGRSL